LGQPSQNFARPAIYVGNLRGGREAICDLINFVVGKDCARTRKRREPIVQWTKASSRRCLVIHSIAQKVRYSRIRKQEDLLSNEAGRHRKLLPKRTHSMDADAYVRIVMPQNELNRDPLEKKDAMLELRPSCEH